MIEQKFTISEIETILSKFCVEGYSLITKEKVGLIMDCGKELKTIIAEFKK